ncbi:MAG: Adenylate kinase [candidate division TM6 bacterium GW2011_GWF2_30_66]|jgi:adenylate kinase|nr:MAG: Adenylate kinase [candidate division TM6 bacterium GW2011_GWF2_30_66]
MSICAKSKIFVLVGSPGSGKGSFSEFCIKNFGWSQLSTGNLCRKHVSNNTEIGKHIDFVLKSGKLVSDNIIFDMVREWLIEQINLGKSILLDGFPRNLVQAEALNSLLNEEAFRNICLFVVKFVVSDDIVIDRLCGRLVCKNKNCQAIYSSAKGSLSRPKNDMICDKCLKELEVRADDNIETIKERLKVYHEHEASLLDFYTKKEKNIIELDASMPIKNIFCSFEEAINLMGLDS